MWPFRSSRPPVQASALTDRPSDATEIAVEAMRREVRGELVPPEALAVAQACIGLWGRSMSSATITPSESLPLAGLNPVVLELCGRACAVRGEALFDISVSGDGVMLLPAASWDVRGGANPAAWRYRLTMAGPSGTYTVERPAASVFHVRTGCEPSMPWRGKAPLAASRATAGLAAAIERQMTKEAGIAPLRLLQTDIPGPESGKSVDEYANQLREGGIRAFPQAPLGTPPGLADRSVGRVALSIGPKPEVSFEALRSHVGEDIANAFGVPTALFSPSGDGSGVREAWRRAWVSTFAPLGRLIETEARDKLDAAATVGFEALRASDEDGRSRAVARRAQAYKVLKDAGIPDAEARRMAGLD